MAENLRITQSLRFGWPVAVMVRRPCLVDRSRDTEPMIAFVAPLAAVFVYLTPPRVWRHTTRHHSIYARARARDYTLPAALRSRVARMTKLALLARREALLHDFLVAATTERPLFRDSAIHKVAPGIELSSTAVTLDFIGNPVIRARVKNLLSTPQSALLIAEITDARGTRARAGAAVLLQPGETRIIELLCPDRLVPTSLTWSAMQL
jgi:hypothetical protein